ncbi:hypothetical protein BDQ17DRAFT_1340385 [Cyathus striatus]|nr:hypothetical protein BDQ17DRAFT_1340385 [Cyathus striatus]
MPDAKKSSGSPRAKPTTRSSLRQSLNLASMGKAFADVIGKDSKDPAKGSKKPKEISTRRLSAAAVKPPAPRASMDGVRPPLQPSKKAPTPDSKTITRRRVSGTLTKSPCEPPPKPSSPPTPPTSGVTRSSSLRPRSMNGPSALPKYRPKSALIESSKPPSSPTARIDIRQRLSSSDDDTTTDDQKSKKNPLRLRGSPSPSIKGNVSISPVAERSALRVNVSALNATPSPRTPTKSKKLATPSSVKGSPSRPLKSTKTASVSSGSSLPRPPSSASSSSSFAPHTPKSGLKGVLGLRRTTQDKGKQSVTPTNGSPKPSVRGSPSPLSRHSPNDSVTSSPENSQSAVGNLSHVSEGDNEDSDEEDVELLLAPVAALGAPTPSMPRIQKKRSIPETPTRSFHMLPGRTNLSYTSPLPPDKENSENKSSLRPPTQSSSGRAARGSILSWEQLASEASRTLGEDEIESMLSDIPAPFRSNPVSPSLSATLEIPESPCLSTLDSPSGYGSISQVLLPDVTPSPAMHHSGRFSLTPDAGSYDSGTVTLLRLQLAAAENTAKERLYQMQAMEEEIHNLKEVHNRQIQETTKQIAYMEEQERHEDEREMYTAALEDQLRHTQAQHERAVEEAVARGQEMAVHAHFVQWQRQRVEFEARTSVSLTLAEWSSVRELSEMELDLVHGDRATLSVLLAELDRICRCLS